MLHKIALFTTAALVAQKTLAQVDNNPYDGEWRAYFVTHPHEYAEYEAGYLGYVHEHPAEFQHILHSTTTPTVSQHDLTSTTHVQQEPAHWTQAQIDLYYA